MEIRGSTLAVLEDKYAVPWMWRCEKDQVNDWSRCEKDQVNNWSRFEKSEE